MSTRTTEAVATLPRARADRVVATLVLGLVSLAATAVLSIALGARGISPWDVLDIVLHPGRDTFETHVLWTERIPRTLLGLLAGAALGASGLVMQAITRNPLADPGVLGIETGAAFCVVVAIVGFGVTGLSGYFWAALLGAAATAVVVYVVGMRTRAADSAIGLVLAGAGMAAFLASLTTLMTIHDPGTYAHLRSWSIGQLTGRAGVLDEAWPFLTVGLLAAPFLGRGLNLLGLGDDAATALGLRVERARLGAAAVAVLLCAAATAACGPIAFVGLAAGHGARALVGPDQRWAIPTAMVVGAVFLVLADVVGRLAPGAGEIPVGVTTALLGTPLFVLLARRPRVVEA